MRVLAFATQGPDGDDEARLRALLQRLRPELFRFERASKLRTALRLLKTIRRDRPDLVFMEGTGIGGGLALIAASLLYGTRYVVSSGDAVGPFLRSHFRVGPLGD